jgi:hypothetical protein
MAKSKDRQIDKFREAARVLEADEDEGKFNDALRRVAKSPPRKPDDDAARKKDR